jgi:hypothetical protein
VAPTAISIPQARTQWERITTETALEPSAPVYSFPLDDASPGQEEATIQVVYIEDFMPVLRCRYKTATIGLGVVEEEAQNFFGNDDELCLARDREAMGLSGNRSEPFEY